MEMRKFDGKNYEFTGWARQKELAKYFANNLKRKGFLVRIVPGKNKYGEMGYLLFRRK